MPNPPAAAIVTVGTELTTGLRQDTNTTDIARVLTEAGYRVRETASVPDDAPLVEKAIRALVTSCELVVVTGGLGPTHDDITREAAARALGRPLLRDGSLAEGLQALAARHTRPESRDRMLRQADVIQGATVLTAVTGSAPGQVVETDAGTTLVLLPGPPGEMRPLLSAFLEGRGETLRPVRLKCAGLTESDTQHIVQDALGDLPVDLTLLAAPGDVEVVLFARDADTGTLDAAATAVREALGTACYSSDGSTLAETVVRLAREAGEVLVCAESCTGGMVSAAITDVPGASDVFAGGVVAYANEVKISTLGVPAGLLAQYGAVSEECARAMTEGALALPGATIAVAVTGVAGPDGGTAEKPVGLVWLAVARKDGRVQARERRLGGDREVVRRRAVTTALDMLRLEIMQGAGDA